MSNKKQSSLDFFAKKLAKKGLLITEDSEYIVAYLEAKAMHKEEIETAWYDGISGGECGSREQYYNETFGSRE